MANFACSSRTLMKIVIALAIVYWAMAIVILIVGILAYVKLEDHVDFIGEHCTVPAGIIITCASIHLLIAGIGIVGSYKGKPLLIIFYATVLLIIIIMELVAGILANSLHAANKDFVNENAMIWMKSYKESDENHAKEIWDYVQRDLHCCGMNSSLDWSDPKLAPRQYLEGPPMSCLDEYNHIYQDGCVDKTIALVNRNLGMIGGFGAGFSGGQWAGCVMAFILAMIVYRTPNYNKV